MYTRTPRVSADLELLNDAALRRYMIKTYYKEGLKKGMVYGFPIGVLFACSIFLLAHYLSK